MRLGRTVLMLMMGASVALSWPQVGRALMITTKIVVCYCLSPR